MASGMSRSTAQDLNLLLGAGTGAGMTDAELLGRIRAGSQEASELAFTAILERHGRLVLGVCRSFLRQPHDVDDAFQATFLVLVRKASSVRVESSLAPWLYGVATRVAHRARSNSNRLRTREGPAVDHAAAEPECDVERFDLRPVLHEELSRLPEKYRLPVVLCNLEGKTHEEAARQLRWPVGTVSGRLSRARQLLRSRLSRRGLDVPAGVLAAPFVPELAMPLSPALVDSTVRAVLRPERAAGLASQVTILSEGVVNSMFWKPTKVAIAAVLVSVVLVGGFGVVAGRLATGASAQAEDQVRESGERTAAPGGSPPIAGAPAAQPPAVPKTAEFSGPTVAPTGKEFVPAPTTNAFPVARMTGVVSSAAILTAESADGTRVLAMSLKNKDVQGGGKGLSSSEAAVRGAKSPSGAWKAYTKTDGVKTRFLLIGDVMPLVYDAGEIKELAVFNGPAAEWSVQPLKAPASGKIWPVVSQSILYYRVDSTIYAYSVSADRWDVLTLRGGEQALIEVDQSAILASQGSTLHVFSAESGRWAEPVEVKTVDPSQSVAPSSRVVDPGLLPPH
jgi:RNA polymerase sigma factor (sigma-70 family)